MDITVSCIELARSLDLARSLTPANPVVLAHGFVQLTAELDRLRVVATDGDTTVHATVQAEVTAEGSVTVSPRSLLPLLQDKAIERVRLVVDSGTLVVSGISRRPYRFTPFLGGISVPPPPPSPPTSVDLSAFPAAVAAVRHACSRDTGIAHLSAANGILSLAATDSYRLAIARITASLDDFSAVISLSALDTIAKRPLSGLSLLPQSRLLGFTGAEVSWTTRPLGLPFPRLDAVVGSRPQGGLELDPAGALARLHRLASVDPSGEHPVHVTLDADVLACTVTSATGTGSEDIPVVAGDLSALDVHLRRSYLADSLAAHGKAVVRLSHSGGLQPIFLSSASCGLELLTVVMPVRA